MTLTVGRPRPARTAPPGARRGKPAGDPVVAWLFLLPALIGFTVFYLAPTLRGFWISLTDWNLLSDPEFVGLDNYRAMLADDKFWNALRITAEYVVINIGTQTVLALAIAVLMDRLTRSVLVRAAIVVPWLVPNVTVAIVTLFMLDHNVGFVNHILQVLGFEPQSFYGDSDQAIATIALVNTWRNMGYTALLFFAGMQMIPRNLYEAAAVDGAGEWTLFRRITLPLLRPVTVLVLVVSIIGSFQIFDTVAVTTKGGPADATRVIYYYIYQKAFNEFHMGYAAAMAATLFVLLIVLTATQMRMLRASSSDLR
ncbi:sugar ABC transporter permease [Acrocarpospora phusangensis]|uniref:Sugar ABC transporter permease n=1 Tax=Acrocarpospora phusangensis TaxID=1070424 RepID=A0A919Q9L8_9ACTN|nr:sugar ABC transporter permease [Acrocarpospora phusangensis]GIH25064.1 sugar ABC transporter permease [Acrocarpospora phusangensis]